MSDSLTSWLRSLDVDALAALLRARPDALEPAPATPEDLAHRLSSIRSTRRALGELSAAALGLSELLQALGGAPRREEVLRHLAVDDPVDAASVELVVAELTSRCLAIERLDRLELVGRMRDAWPDPLGFGEPVEATLRLLPAPWLDQVRATLGLRTDKSAPKAAAAVAGHLTRARIGELVAEAPADARALLARAAEHGPVPAPNGTAYSILPTRWRQPSPYTWLTDRALLLPVDPFSLAVPREVGMALRAEHWTVRLPLRPPDVVTAAADDVAVERESAAAAGAAVGTATELLEALAGQPAAALKTGGLGVREIRRLAKALRCGEAPLELAAHVAGGCELVAVQGSEVLPTPAYDDWRAAEPAVRLASLLRAWWDCPAAVTGRIDDNGKPEPPLARTRPDPEAAALRRDLLGALDQLPAGRGATGVDTVLQRLAWAHPMGYPPADGELERLAGAAWWEAEQLGLAAHGRATALGRALLAGDDAALLARARDVLPPAVDVVVLQADLTAVVAGSPSAAVAALLDEAADREARGNAAVWRFSAASVRRVLDAGGTAEDLLQRLGAVARGGLPQPLTYLVHDVARRHGQLAVTSLSCAVVADDAALLAEVASHRSLRALAPRLLAPTVMASARPPGETVRLLRQAGYAPVQRDRDGQVVVERVRRGRAAGSRDAPGTGPTASARAVGPFAVPPQPVVPRGGRPAGTRAERVDAEQVARALLAAGPPAAAARGSEATGRGSAPDRLAVATTTAAQLAALAPRLAPDEVALLAHAVETGGPVAVDYVDTNGTATHRVLSGCELAPPFLHAWCHLRQDERVFTVSRVTAVSPA